MLAQAPNGGGGGDVVDFVSRVLGEDEDVSMSLDAKMSSVSMKLQVMQADLTEEVQRCMQELAEAGPRAGHEVKQISRLLEGVSEEASSVSDRASQQASEASEAETLDELETFRRNMAEAERILSLSTSWDALVIETRRLVEEVAENGAMPVAAIFSERVTVAEKALRQMPNASSRKRFVESVRDEMEVALRPRVSKAVTISEEGEGMDALRELVETYERLGLADSLVRDYASARPATLHRRWFARPTGEPALAPWLSTFLDDCLALVEKETKSCLQAFGETTGRSAAAMTARAIFSPLASSFADRLVGDVKDVASCRQLCCDFAGRVRTTTGCDDRDAAQVAVAVAGQPFEKIEYGKMEIDYFTTLKRRASALDDVGSALSAAEASLDELFADELPSAARRCELLTGGMDGGGYARACNAAAIAFGNDLAVSLDALKARFVQHDLPIDTTLLSDNWSKAKEAFGAISLAGKLETKLGDYSAGAAHTVRDWCEALLEENDSTSFPSEFFPVKYARQAVRIDRKKRIHVENLLADAGQAAPLERVKLEKCLDDLNAAANSFVFELAFSPIRSALRRVSKTRLSPDAGRLSYCRPAVFSKGQPSAQPNEYITVVGNHLIAALHELEPFLSSDSVRDALAARVDAAGRLTDGLEWSKLGDSLELSDADRLGLRALSSGRSVDGVTLGDSTADDDLLLRPQEASQRFCNDWLECLFRATVAAFLDELVRVDAVDDVGSIRLKNDITYLLNVADTLDLPKHAVLKHIQILADTPTKADLDKIVRQRNFTENNSAAANVLSKIEIAFASARARGEVDHL